MGRRPPAAFLCSGLLSCLGGAHHFILICTLYTHGDSWKGLGGGGVSCSESALSHRVIPSCVCSNDVTLIPVKSTEEVSVMSLDLNRYGNIPTFLTRLQLCSCRRLVPFHPNTAEPVSLAQSTSFHLCYSVNTEEGFQIDFTHLPFCFLATVKSLFHHIWIL